MCLLYYFFFQTTQLSLCSCWIIQQCGVVLSFDIVISCRFSTGKTFIGDTLIIGYEKGHFEKLSQPGRVEVFFKKTIVLGILQLFCLQIIIACYDLQITVVHW